MREINSYPSRAWDRLLPKNKQTWKKSSQTLMDSRWTGDLHIDALLNRGGPEGDYSKVPPRKWVSDPAFKGLQKTVITYSFITKKRLIPET